MDREITTHLMIEHNAVQELILTLGYDSCGHWVSHLLMDEHQKAHTYVTAQPLE